MKIDDLDYTPTGELIWRRTKGRAKKGSLVGWIHNKHGYREMNLDGVRKKVHHVVWFLHRGEWPEMLDHINGIRDDNRIENLRECTAAENARNRKKKDNRTLPRNVYYSLTEGKYRVYLTIDGKTKSFGTFSELDTADKIAQQARDEYYGAFAGS